MPMLQSRSAGGVVLAGLLLSSQLIWIPSARAQDLDGDGWSVQDGDCCDVPSGLCTRPELVNPGAYDVPGNGIDDDCDGTIDNPTPTNCSMTAVFSGISPLTLAMAMDLCQNTTENPPLPQKTWGLISAEWLRASGPGAPNPIQSAAMTSFGVDVLPVENATMAVISSGTARDRSDPGYIAPNPGFTDPSNVVQAPPSFTIPNGGLYHREGCPQPGTTVFDSARLRLRLRVPTNASGLHFSHRFFSAEYPNTCTPYNDHLLCLEMGGAAGLPADGNILRDALANPMTVQTALFENCIGCPQGTADLIGTGYDPNGGATAWHTASGPVVPGESIVLEFHIWDSTDGLNDALTLLDAFEWEIIPQDPPSAVGDDGDAAGPLAIALRASPNPFAETADIAFQLPVGGRAVVDIVDVSGRRVRRLADADFPAHTNRLSWDGRDDAGRPVASGVYLARVQTGGQTTSRLLVLER